MTCSSQTYLLLEGRHKARLVESKGSFATSLDIHFGQLPQHKVAGQQQSLASIGVALGHLQDQQAVVGQQGRALVQPLAPARSTHNQEAAVRTTSRASIAPDIWRECMGRLTMRPFQMQLVPQGPLGHAEQLYLEERGWPSQYAAESERVTHLGTRQPGNDLAQFSVGIAAELGMQGVVHLKCHLSLKRQSSEHGFVGGGEVCGWLPQQGNARFVTSKAAASVRDQHHACHQC